jgi:hypothetical protein
MGEIIQFVPRSERQRARLIEEARAIYGRIFPLADAVSEAGTRASETIAVDGEAHCGQAAVLGSDRIVER